MTPRNLIVAAIAVCGIAAALLLGMQLGARSTVHAVADVNPQPTGEASESPVRNPVERPLPLARPSPDPLPPVDTPLADVFDDLMARADRGDDRAACRLALEMQACDIARQRRFFFPAPMEIPSERDTSRMTASELEMLESAIETAERMDEEFHAISAHCEGVPELPFRRQLGWLRLAAQAGHPAAVHEYVGGEAFPGHLWIRESPLLSTYRRDLEPMAWRAMEAGDVEMAWRLMNAYMPQPDVMRSEPLAQMMDADPVMALALGFFIEDAVGRVGGDPDSITAFRALTENTVRHLLGEVDAAQMQEAQARSRAWVRSIDPGAVESSPYNRFGVGQEAAQQRRHARFATCDAG